MLPRVLIGLALVASCDARPPPRDKAVLRDPIVLTEVPGCAEQFPNKRPLWGDLHVHTSYSFDAHSYGLSASPEDAYAFARGQGISVGPQRRKMQLRRPLDFVGLSDHAEFFGEVKICRDPSAKGYHSSLCQAVRAGDGSGAFKLGVLLSLQPKRSTAICGNDLQDCLRAARSRWHSYVAAADQVTRASNCSFSALVGYEYTNTFNVSNLHRNVFFRDRVPAMPVTYFEAPTPRELWGRLDAHSRAGVQSLVIPHNSNLSNGQLFHLQAEMSADEVKLRQRMEPVVEIHQHKGSSECRNGMSNAAADPLCDFEKLRGPDAPICDKPGKGGMRLWGCVHPLDFVRNVLGHGLAQQKRLGTNPYRLGFVGATDTHNGTPGLVASHDFGGHVGVADDTPDKRLHEGNKTHDTYIYNPGGLTAVFARQNRREDIFDAISARETYATSGPRIEVRTFGGFDVPDHLCQTKDIASAYKRSAPMGAAVPYRAGAPFRMWVSANRDPDELEGADLAKIQIIKGWQQNDETHYKVIDVIGGDIKGSAACGAPARGHSALCGYHVDDSPTANSFYYARVVEVPTCRWSQRQCQQPEIAESPGCKQPSHVQQMAWTSPIWVTE